MTSGPSDRPIGRLAARAALVLLVTAQLAHSGPPGEYCGGARQPSTPSDLENVVGELTLQAIAEGRHPLRCGYGYVAEKCGDHATAVRIFESCVERGHAGAMIWLGALYENGNGVPRSPEKAVELYARAARSGHAGYSTLGKLHYGMALYHGIGVQRNEPEGLRWLRLAAEDGDRDAAEFLRARQSPSPR